MGKLDLYNTPEYILIEKYLKPIKKSAYTYVMTEKEIRAYLERYTSKRLSLKIIVRSLNEQKFIRDYEKANNITVWGYCIEIPKPKTYEKIIISYSRSHNKLEICNPDIAKYMNFDSPLFAIIGDCDYYEFDIFLNFVKKKHTFFNDGKKYHSISADSLRKYFHDFLSNKYISYNKSIFNI